MSDTPSSKYLLRVITALAGAVMLLLIVVIVLCFCLWCNLPPDTAAKPGPRPQPDAFGNFTPEEQARALKPRDTTNYWIAPRTEALLGRPDEEQIRYGRELVANTAHYFGPRGSIKKGATNGMNCQNCHLDAGTKIFGNNYGGVAPTYPKYRARSGSVENIYKRITDCFERSLNGIAPDSASREMQAMAAYINWLGKDVKKGTKPAGSGLKDIRPLERAASSEKGSAVYTARCATCHGSSGEGRLDDAGVAYIYPPLWGEHSYNDGAGLFRISNFAKYAKYNMPFGITYENPQLSDEEAWDVAAFVNSQPRPHKEVPGDWPKVEEKPVDHPFGPYADAFTETQHKYGPYTAMKKKSAAPGPAAKNKH